MKKIILIFILFAVVCTSANAKELKLTVGSREMTSTGGGNTKTITLESPPKIVNGRTFLPLRPLFEELGGEVRWRAQASEVGIRYNNRTMLLTIGSNTAAWGNGTQMKIDQNSDVVPFVENGFTLLPLRFISEAFGLKVEWNEAEQSVTVSDSNIAAASNPNRTAAPLNTKIDTSGMVPIIDMKDETYKGFTGMLYNGSNTPPAEYLEYGIKKAKEIVPLDKDGKPDDNGAIVFMSVGMSNTTQSFSVFMDIARTEKGLNPKMTIIDGAIGGQAIAQMNTPDKPYWNQAMQRLTDKNVTAKQVQAVWIKQAFIRPDEVFPENAQKIQEGFRDIINIIRDKYPNVKVIYLSSRTYGGYATTQLNPEPYAYEAGFGVKWLINDIIRENGSDYPYVAWGPYLWANGETVRSDGLFNVRGDFADDGTHPSPSGRRKVANLLLEFLKTDETAKIWFLQ